MFESLKVFDIREVAEEDYHVPAIDLTSDSLVEPEIFPPDAPVVIGIGVSGITWETVPTATGYQVENLLTGTIWTILEGPIPASPKVQIVWDGYEWLIQKLVNGVWLTQYVSVNDNAILNYTPDQATEWSPENGAAPAPTVVSFDPIASGGLLVAGAGDSEVNADYALSGTMNELNSYTGPSIATYSFSPTVGILYRVRAFNSAGDGPASNTVVLSEPPFDCGGNPSDVSGLLWTENSNSGDSSDGFTIIATSLSEAGPVVSFNCSASTVAAGGDSPNSRIDVSSAICNPSAQDKTLIVTLSAVGFSIDSVQGVYMSCRASVIVNGNETYIYNSPIGQGGNSGTDSGGAISNPLTFVLPAQSISTIEITALCGTDLGDGTATDSSQGQATLTFSIE